MIDEAAVRDRMRSLAAAGDYAGALSEYVALEAHPEAAPSRETRRLLEEIRRWAPPPLGTGQFALVELDGDHTDAERAELHDGEENPFDSRHVGLFWEDHERRVVIRDRGRMIACCGLIIAGVEVAGESFAVVGFGGVIVTRTRRGAGFARRVMEGALTLARSLGPSHGLLFCRPDRAGLYAKLGFATVEAPVSVAQPDGRRADMSLETMWCPLRAGATWPDGPVSLPGLPF